MRLFATAGAMLRDARLTLDRSQLALARRANISKNTIQSYERGDTEPSPRTLQAVSRALRVVVTLRNGNWTWERLDDYDAR